MLSYFLYHTFCVDLQFRQVLITVAQSLCQILGLSSIFLGPVWNLWVVNHKWKIYSGFQKKSAQIPMKLLCSWAVFHIDTRTSS